MSGAAGVVVWEEAPGSWRYRYVEPPPGAPDAGARAELPSHQGYPTQEAALSAACGAFPGVPVRVEPSAAVDTRSRGCRRSLARTAVVAVLLVLVAVRTRWRAGRRVQP